MRVLPALVQLPRRSVSAGGCGVRFVLVIHIIRERISYEIAYQLAHRMRSASGRQRVSEGSGRAGATAAEPRDQGGAARCRRAANPAQPRRWRPPGPEGERPGMPRCHRPARSAQPDGAGQAHRAAPCHPDRHSRSAGARRLDRARAGSCGPARRRRPRRARPGCRDSPALPGRLRNERGARRDPGRVRATRTSQWWPTSCAAPPTRAGWQQSGCNRPANSRGGTLRALDVAFTARASGIRRRATWQAYNSTGLHSPKRKKTPCVMYA